MAQRGLDEPWKPALFTGRDTHKQGRIQDQARETSRLAPMTSHLSTGKQTHGRWHRNSTPSSRVWEDYSVFALAGSDFGADLRSDVGT